MFLVENEKGVFDKNFPLPKFAVKRQKKAKAQIAAPSVAVVDDIIQVLEKKEEEKRLKEIQISRNKEERKKNKLINEKEMKVLKSFQENKKRLLQNKKTMNAELKELKKTLKSDKTKENASQMKDRIKMLNANIEELDRLLLAAEMQALSKKMKIKEEKF